jgi:ferrous iron transport protein B
MPFIMELPLYRQPDWKTIGSVVWTRTVSIVKKAGTVILAVSVIVWFLSYFPGERIEDSYLAWFGRFLEPFGAPIGLDWRMVTALLTSIIAKENAVATLGVLYGVGREGLVQTLPGVMSGPSALAFLTVLMLFVPCAATVVVMKRELGSWRWFGVSMVLMLIVSFLAGMVAFRLGGWLGL